MKAPFRVNIYTIYKILILIINILYVRTQRTYIYDPSQTADFNSVAEKSFTHQNDVSRVYIICIKF